jgi:hypothetical protein
MQIVVKVQDIVNTLPVNTQERPRFYPYFGRFCLHAQTNFNKSVHDVVSLFRDKTVHGVIKSNRESLRNDPPLKIVPMPLKIS